MNNCKLHTFAAALSCVGMLIAPVATASPAVGQTAPSDVALTAGGTLVGQVVDAQGGALAQAPVAIGQNGREVIRVATNANGEFSVAGLRGGVYEIAAPGHYAQYRVWAPRTAPPAARNGLLVVAGDSAVLGQSCGPACGPACGAAAGPFGAVTSWVSQHPLMTAGIIAAAVAIPLAIDDDDDAS